MFGKYEFRIIKKQIEGSLHTPGGMSWTPCGGGPGSNEFINGLSGVGPSNSAGMLFGSGGLCSSKSELGLLEPNCVGVALSSLY